MKANNFEDKWNAIALSFLIPGSGQLLVGSWQSIIWFALAALLSVVLRHVFPAQSILSIFCGALSFIMLGFFSAQNIKHFIERKQKRSMNPNIKEEMLCESIVDDKVDISLSIHVPLNRKRLWNIISNLEQFLIVDPLHKCVRIENEQKIILEHEVLGYRFLRFGKILYWDEGYGYAFSDISSRGSNKGFPHVFYINITSENEETSKLNIRVRGKWTDKWIPKFLRNLWLRNICREHSLLLLNYLSMQS